LSRFGAIDQEGGAAWSDLELVLEVARAYSHVDNDAKVERFFLRCAELNPRRAALYRCQIGWFFQRKKRWARALSWYDQALETFPSYHLCLFRKGYCLERLHRPREAAQALRLAAESFDRTGEDQRERSRGIQIQVLFHLARNLREAGETAAAREALDRCGALDDRPGDRVIKVEHRLASYGETYLREGDAAKALEHLEEARQRDPRSAVIWERLGRAYELAGDRAHAEAAYRRAVDLPKGAIALVSLGRFLIQEGRLREAAETLSQALERHPQSEVQVRIEMADLQRKLGRAGAALDDLLQLLAGRVPPRSTLAASIDSRIADILIEHDHLKRALPHLAAALEQSPGDEVLEKAHAEAERRLRDGPPEEQRAFVNADVPPELAAILAFEPKRSSGTIESYFPERGFGFIRDTEGGTIFFHVSHFPLPPGRAVEAGCEVTFVAGVNHRNRKPQAEQIRLREKSARAATAGRGGDRK
jgi:tetratricopeptide (TPR) repeat protein/cold shock CspA family protein